VGVVPKHAKKEKTPPLYKQNIFREKKSAYIYIYILYIPQKRRGIFRKVRKSDPLGMGKKNHLGFPADGGGVRSMLSFSSASASAKSHSFTAFFRGCSQNCLKVQEKYRDPKTAARLSLI